MSLQLCSKCGEAIDCKCKSMDNSAATNTIYDGRSIKLTPEAEARVLEKGQEFIDNHLITDNFGKLKDVRKEFDYPRDYSLLGLRSEALRFINREIYDAIVKERDELKEQLISKLQKIKELETSECQPFDAYYKTCEVMNGQLEARIKELELANDEITADWQDMKYKYDNAIERIKHLEEAFKLIIDEGIDTSTDGGITFIKEILGDKK